MESYEPVPYWLERGKVYKDCFRYNKNFRLQEEFLLEYLHTLSPPFSSVFEAGCGFGRITKLILSNFESIREYTAVDLSPDQVRNAMEYVRPSVIGKSIDLKFMVSDIQSIQADRKYDLVIASEMLMHVLPNEIAQVMNKLVSLSNSDVVNIDYYDDRTSNPKLAPHNFLHQYEKIYCEIPSILAVKRIPIVRKGLLKTDIKQSIFHAKLTHNS